MSGGTLSRQPRLEPQVRDESGWTQDGVGEFIRALLREPRA
jgi:hypothetical protein